jgi:hypothetical protein
MRWRRVAGIAAIVIALGGVGVATTGLFVYNEATKIERGDPEVVTDEYLRAALVRKDEVGSELYTCADDGKLEPIRALRRELDQREKDFDVTVLVSWGAYDRQGDKLVAKLDISGRKGNAVTSKRTETWKFTVVEEDGWRVCGAERVSQPSASPTPATTP